MSLTHTRSMIRAALEGNLDRIPTATHPVFGVNVPKECPGVPPEVLNQRGTWKDAARYDGQAIRLAKLFQDNFKQFESQVSEAVRKAGPVG